MMAASDVGFGLVKKKERRRFEDGLILLIYHEIR